MKDPKMTKEEINIEVDKSTEIKGGRYLIGTIANHQLGELSREDSSDKLDCENLFCASRESDDYYIGMWILGYGFFNVCFPKETSRELTKKEIEKYNKSHVAINNQPSINLKVD